MKRAVSVPHRVGIKEGKADAALWQLSLILREIAQDQSGVAGKESLPAASQQTGVEVSSMEGPPDE